MAKDFYDTLGVKKTASKDEIKKAYRKLARKWHPDINPGNKDAEQKFKDISRAYDCLGNEDKRKLYDEFGEEGLQSGFDAEKARQYKQWSGFQQSAGGGAGSARTATAATLRSCTVGRSPSTTTPSRRNRFSTFTREADPSPWPR